MFFTINALILRIFFNPMANAFQKGLSEKYSSVTINFYTYLFMSVFCIIPALHVNWSLYGFHFWCYVFLAGLFCCVGTICLIKALQIGELSVLGPINSYKCIVGLISAFILLGEVPSLSGFLGLILIVFGSWFIFDAVQEKFSLKIFLRKDILLRLFALILSGTEAAILKKIILISSFKISFILWAFTGLVFSFLMMILMRRRFFVIEKIDYSKIFLVTISLTIMQLSTNYVFKFIDVGLSLALFQLSSLITLFLGYRYFNEKNIIKKLIGTLIMIFGSALILIF